ncbi:hypothetical protein [Stenotrophomonas maltophilia]|uniref:hypothetical protein n=1 Tax=Stenotrophomonas maltophilia TaxID=40324 RepID=UPI000C159A4F|nr:hypothetical protein [Stenotrophomonas maltophilia]
MNEPSNSGQKPSQALCTAELRRNAHVLVLQEMRTRFTDAGSPSRTAALDAAIAALSPQPSPATCKEGLQVQPSPGGQGDAQYVLVNAAHLERVLVCAEGNHFDDCMADRTTTMAQAIEQMREALAASQPVRHVSLPQADLDLINEVAARQPAGEPVEMSPEFTDTARAAIAWVLWHHQGGSSPVGQPLRFSLGMGQHDRMTDHQIAEAKRFAEWSGATTEGFHRHKTAQAADLGQLPRGIRLVEIPRRNGLDPINVLVQDYELGRGRIVVTCYGQAWCGFWGAMGDRTVMQFVSACDADYVAGNMLSGRHEYVKKHERSYVERIATEVIAEFRALIDSQAVGNG